MSLIEQLHLLHQSLQLELITTDDFNRQKQKILDTHTLSIINHIQSTDPRSKTSQSNLTDNTHHVNDSKINSLKTHDNFINLVTQLVLTDVISCDKAEHLLFTPSNEMICMSHLFIDAAKKNKISLLKSLLSMNVDINSFDQNKKTALVHSSYFGNVEATELLLNSKADPSDTLSGLPPLIYTTCNYFDNASSHMNCAQLLISASADPCVKYWIPTSLIDKHYTSSITQDHNPKTTNQLNLCAFELAPPYSALKSCYISSIIMNNWLTVPLELSDMIVTYLGFRYVVGQYIDVIDTIHVWCFAIVESVVETDNNQYSIRIHYIDWSRNFDENINAESERLKPLGTMTVNPNTLRIRDSNPLDRKILNRSSDEISRDFTVLIQSNRSLGVNT